MSGPRVAYWNNIPAPYVVDRFNAAAAAETIEFEAWFSSRTDPGRSWRVDESSWRFRYRYLPSVLVRGSRLALPTPLLRRDVPDLLVSLYGTASFVSGWALARRRGVRTVFWVEPTFDTWFKRRAWKNRVKRAAFARVEAVLTPGRDGAAFAVSHGADPDRIFFLPYFVDHEFFAQRRAEARARRDVTRAELGLSGVTFAYVGRLWRPKGVDVLLDAFAALRRERDDVSLLLVGDGPDEQRLRRRCDAEGIDGVVFTGFRDKDALPALHAAADVFVFPTLGDPYGFAVDEAMSSGLPVVSTTAAGEIAERVADGVHGLLVPPGDAGALRAALAALAGDAARREAMSAAAAVRYAGRSPERWVEEFERAVAAILALPPRASAA